MDTQTNQPVLGVLQTFQQGVQIVITDNALNYCEIRASQLSALLLVICGDGHSNFVTQDDLTQDTIKWLASSLADEIKDLLPIVIKEAELRVKATYAVGARGTSS